MYKKSEQPSDVTVPTTEAALLLFFICTYTHTIIITIYTNNINNGAALLSL